MADFDESSPADDDIVSQFPANERAARSAVKTNFGIEHHDTDDADIGKHLRVTFKDPLGSKPTIGASEGALYTKDVSSKAELFFEDEDGDEVQVTSGGKLKEDIIPANTKMIFKQSTAPTGWTFASEDNDRVIINTSTVGQGGDTGGSWTISGISVDGHALTEAEMPVHNHGFDGNFGYEALAAGSSTFRTTGSTDTDNAGSGNAHDHDLTIGNSWRPLYVKVITCTKD